MSGADSILPTTEQELIARIRVGEEWAFDLMMKQYQIQLYQYAVHFVHSPDLAADAVQDVFVSIWERRSHLTITGSLQAYLFRAVRNTSIAIHKSELSRSHREGSLASQLPTSSEDTVIESIEWNEFSVSVRRAIDELPDRGREVFILVRDHGLSYSEVADTLGVSLSTVKTQMARSMNTLVKKLSRFF